MQFMSFDATGDTLFVSDDHGSSSKDNREIAYILRSEEFRKAHPYVYDRTGYNNVYCALNKSLYYNTYWKGGLQKLFTILRPVAKRSRIIWCIRK